MAGQLHGLSDVNTGNKELIESCWKLSGDVNAGSELLSTDTGPHRI